MVTGTGLDNDSALCLYAGSDCRNSSDRGNVKMFNRSAEWYDALYSFKDYRLESDAIISILKRLHPGAESILDIACGTAEHDRYISSSYRVDGLDINPDFIDIASGKNPEGEYFCADMSNFSIPQKYDIILCLFNSIAYLKTMINVRKAFWCFKDHLKKTVSLYLSHGLSRRSGIRTEKFICFPEKQLKDAFAG